MAPRGREYPPETVWQAQELYCVTRLTFAQISAELNVAASTLKRWGDKHEWRKMREELAQAEANMRADIIMARSSMLKKLIETTDPQTAFAVANLEALAMRQAEAARTQKQIAKKDNFVPRKIHTAEDAVAALKDAVQMRLNGLLLSPDDADLRAVQDVQKTLALIADMSPKTAPKTLEKQSLSAETNKRIEELLGYK